MNRLPRALVGLLAGLAALGIASEAGAITGATIDPGTLSSSSQPITVTFSGKDPSPTTGSPTVDVQQCRFNDTKPGFDPFADCSDLSRQTKNVGNVASGTVTYTGAFVGVDPDTSEYSFCAPTSGVPDFQSGFFRVADNVSDQGDDFFVAFTCGAPEVPEAPFPALLTGFAVIGIGGALVVVNRSRSRRLPATA